MTDTWQRLLAGFVAAAALGCGANTGDVQGKISLDSQPLADGVISFQPEKETPAPSVGGRVVDGAYEVRGVVPGEYRVEVRAWVTTEKIVKGPFGPTKERLNIIPKRYWGEETQLRANVRPGSNTIHFEMVK